MTHRITREIPIPASMQIGAQYKHNIQDRLVQPDYVIIGWRPIDVEPSISAIFSKEAVDAFNRGTSLKDYVLYLGESYNTSSYEKIEFFTSKEHISFTPSTMHNIKNWMILNLPSSDTLHQWTPIELSTFLADYTIYDPSIDNEITQYYGKDFIPIYHTIQKLWKQQEYYKTIVGGEQT